MPIYEYQCTECRERHEIIQKISDPALTHCPHCGGAMKKLISSPAIQFKGSGFYKTDYASSSAKSSNGGNGKGDSAGASESSKSDAKPEAAKTETKSESKASD